ncbi:MAG: hypothetical protein R2877_07925 [Bdellovibrionota bacterium]
MSPTALARKIKTKLVAKLTIMTNLTKANRMHVAVLAHDMNDFSILSVEIKKRNRIFGPKYWLLRSDFYKYAKKRRKTLGNIQKIMLMFGGTDPSDFFLGFGAASSK